MSADTTEIDALLNADGMNVIHSVALLAIMSGDKMAIAEARGIVMGTLAVQIETLTGTIGLIDEMPAALKSGLASARVRASALVALAERMAATELAKVRAWDADRKDEQE